jgi:hypothetical protein
LYEKIAPGNPLDVRSPCPPGPQTHSLSLNTAPGHFGEPTCLMRIFKKDSGEKSITYGEALDKHCVMVGLMAKRMRMMSIPGFKIHSAPS